MQRVVLVLLAGCGRVAFDPLADAANDAAVDAADPCAPHVFCDDFDRAGLVEDGWDGLIGTGGTMSLVTDRSVSPPGSLLVAMPMGAVGNVTLTKAFGTQVTRRARVAFQLSYDTTNGGVAELDLVRLRWTDVPAPCTGFGYFLVRDSTGPLIMQETYTGCGGNVNTPVVFGTGFQHVAMDVWFGSVGTARVRVEIDGVSMFDTMPPREIPASRVFLEVGVPSQRNLIAPWEVRYDDLIVDLD